MSVLVEKDTKVLVQGFTGKTVPTLVIINCLRYQHAGVLPPGKGGNPP